jgi:hypothetical protein
MFNFVAFLISFLFSSSIIVASPESFDPLDAYKQLTVPEKGPTQLKVRFLKTRENASAQMTYNKKNQIERIDFSKEGNAEGYSTFHYGPHGILEEKIFDTKENIMETVFYLYNSKGILEGYKVLNKNGKEIIRWEYRYHKGKLYSGIRTTQEAITEKFYMRQLSGNQILQSIFDDTGEKAAEITFSYEKGRILSREFNSAMKRKVEYKYDESGKLAEVLTSEEINGMMQVTSVQKFQY